MRQGLWFLAGMIVGIVVAVLLAVLVGWLQMQREARRRHPSVMP